MYNSDTPLRADLPSTKQLLRSTALAAISAVVLLVTIVLPAEYGVDPTGIGRVLRMTEMGEVKQQLAAEAAADAAATKTAAVTSLPAAAPAATQVTAAPAAVTSAADATQLTTVADVKPVAWRDEIPFTLAPGESREIKMKMKEGEKADFIWVVEGGSVNFDAHGDALLKSISYKKGRGVPQDEGVLQAAFTGSHGWYWRNRGQAEVKVILRTRGEYASIK